MYYLARLEETGLSTTLRESGLAFFTSLSIHGVAMAFVVGINIAISVLILSNRQVSQPSALAKFFPLHRFAVLLIFFSGAALLLAYPAKALTNPVFYLKLAALTVGLLIASRFQRDLKNQTLWHRTNNINSGEQPATKMLRSLAAASLIAWTITISAGRFLAYTNSVLLASRFY